MFLSHTVLCVGFIISNLLHKNNAATLSISW